MNVTSQNPSDGGRAVRSFILEQANPRLKHGRDVIDAMRNSDKLRNRLEPYNNIAVVATLLAGFALTIFPTGVDADLEDDDFPWGAIGHAIYNVLMGISFSINVVITVMVTLQLYFTQQLVVQHSATIAMRYMDSTEFSRRIAVGVFYVVSIPTFMGAFTILLFAALDHTAAMITSSVIFAGLIIVLLCIRSFYIIYGKALEGVTSFDAHNNEERVVISRSTSAFDESGSDIPRLAPHDLPSKPIAIDGPVMRERRFSVRFDAPEEALEGVTSFDAHHNEERVVISRSTSAFDKSGSDIPRLAPHDLPSKPIAIDGPVMRERRFGVRFDAPEEALEGVTSFDAHNNEERVVISRSTSAFDESGSERPRLAPHDLPSKPIAIDGPVMRESRFSVRFDASAARR